MRVEIVTTHGLYKLETDLIGLEFESSFKMNVSANDGELRVDGFTRKPQGSDHFKYWLEADNFPLTVPIYDPSTGKFKNDASVR